MLTNFKEIIPIWNLSRPSWQDSSECIWNSNKSNVHLKSFHFLDNSGFHFSDPSEILVSESQVDYLYHKKWTREDTTIKAKKNRDFLDFLVVSARVYLFVRPPVPLRSGDVWPAFQRRQFVSRDLIGQSVWPKFNRDSWTVVCRQVVIPCA